MMRFKALSMIVKVEERFKQHHVSGLGDKAVFTAESAGWWAVLPGHLSIYLGTDKPPDSVHPGAKAYLILDVPEA